MAALSQGSSTAQWYTLVTQAEAHSNTLLDQDVESYVVFMLMRFCDNPQMTKSVLALDFLTSLQQKGQHQQQQLQAIGDQCLLLNGLFPQRTESKNVSKDYFVQLGQSAYAQLDLLASEGFQLDDRLYQKLAEHFIPLSALLDAMRNIGSADQTILNIETCEPGPSH